MSINYPFDDKIYDNNYLLHIYNGTDKNVFTYYEDAGNGFDYKQNEYCKRMIEFELSNKKITIAKQEGSFNSNFKKMQLIFYGFHELKNIHVNNSNAFGVNDCSCKLLNELDNPGDVYDPNLYQQLLFESQKVKQQQVVIDNSREEITISW